MLPRRLTLPALVLALLGAAATVLVSTPTATASSVVLCRGFVNCNAKGYSNHGYEKVYRQMWWRMYAGHNCTNYVAYRMVDRGMSATRPWSGSGDARNWGVVFSEKVNQTPMVGSIAWWSSNHVAYVERIIDKDTFVISEDHYGGDFNWRRITRSGGGWPTGFIHLNDERVTPVTRPLAAGTPQVDQEIVAQRGQWSQPGATYSYQWYANGQPISGANQQTYAPTPGLVGVPIQVRVRAVKAGYLAGATFSPLTPATAPGRFTSATAPVINGIAKVGATLSTTPATFAPEPTSTRTAWFADGVRIAGETGGSLELTPEMLGKKITVHTAGLRDGYLHAGVLSRPTAEVGPEKIVVSREPTLSGSSIAGRRLVVGGARMTPSGLDVSYAWTRDGVAIPGRTASTFLLGAADVGHKIGVRVTWTKPGYTPVTRTLVSNTVRAYPRISLASLEHRQLTVAVRALGVPVVRGQVVVRARGGQSRTLTLVNGRATFTAPWIYAGERTYTVEYLGSGLVLKYAAVRTVQVR